jgi:hypothetical protein
LQYPVAGVGPCHHDRPHFSRTAGSDSFEKLSVMSLWEVDVVDILGRGVVRWDPDVGLKSSEGDAASLSVSAHSVLLNCGAYGANNG